MTSHYISETEVSLRVSLLSETLTLTADSVKNNSVKLSIKFMVFEIQSKGQKIFVFF